MATRISMSTRRAAIKAEHRLYHQIAPGSKLDNKKFTKAAAQAVKHINRAMGKAGVHVLQYMTPSDTGETAEDWYYRSTGIPRPTLQFYNNEKRKMGYILEGTRAHTVAPRRFGVMGFVWGEKQIYLRGAVTIPARKGQKKKFKKEMSGIFSVWQKLIDKHLSRLSETCQTNSLKAVVEGMIR